MRKTTLIASVLLVLSASGSAPAADPTYWRDVRPVLRKSCTVCHNPRQLSEKEISGGLALDTLDRVLVWKEKGKNLVSRGKSTDSLLYRVLIEKNTEKRMPLGTHPLLPESIALVKRWIDSGAAEGERPAEVPLEKRPVVRRRLLDVALPASAALKVGPLSPVTALAFHPDGKVLAAGSYGQVVLWDIIEGKPSRVLTAVLGAVNDLRFSPDGKTLAVAGGQPSARGDLRLFALDGKLLRVLAGHDDVVACAAFSPDGSTLASASYDRTARTWDVATGKLRRSFTHHSDFVTCVAWSADGKNLFTGSKDHSVRMVDAATGTGKFTFSDREDDILSIALHPDGKSLAVTGMTPTISWWDPATGSKLRSTSGHRGPANELAFDRKGAQLVSAGNDGTARVYNGATGALLRSVAVGSVAYSVAISADGKRAAAGGFDGLTRLFDPTTGKVLAVLLSHADGWLAMTPEGYSAGDAATLKLVRWPKAAILVNPANLRLSLAGQAVPVPPK